MMSYTIFDCTQLITVNAKGENSIKNIKRDFEQLGFMIKTDNQISRNKLNYFKGYLYDTVIELVDKEFIGEFEDWKDIFNPPIRITKLVDKLRNIINDKNVENVKFIIISSASENKKEDNILQLLSSEQDLAASLFIMSGWNFDLKTEVLILKLV